MVALVDHLEQSGKAKHLYGFTSMFALVISQTPPSHPNLPPHLRIEPRNDGTIEFRFFDSGRPEDQWRRAVQGSESVHRLESFFEQLRWFGGAKEQQ
jgi:hypothetical protein